MTSIALRVASFASLMTVACCVQSYAVEPAIGSLNPIGFQRGTELEFAIGGARLANAQELLFYSPGITVTTLAPRVTAPLRRR